MFRCMDFTKAPGGYLQCTLPLGHPDRELHRLNIEEQVISEETLTVVQKILEIERS